MKDTACATTWLGAVKFCESWCNYRKQQRDNNIIIVKSLLYMLLYTVELPKDILYNGHLIMQDTMLWSGLNLPYVWYFTALRNEDTSLFCKADRFCSPASTWTVQNPLNNADAGRPLAQDCLAPLIDSSTGHYTDTGTHSSSLWLSFPVIVNKCWQK